MEVKPQPASDLSAASGSLQGVFASKALEAGDSLAAIPLELTFSIKGGGSGHIMVSTRCHQLVTECHSLLIGFLHTLSLSS